MNFSDRISLPNDAVTQTLASIGRKGAGKTYLATLLAEQMLSIGAQVIALDPVGNWWGLRVGQDGKSKGKDIFIAGGERGDVPVLPETGARFAKLVVEKNVSIVIDVSGFRQGERKRFAADFAEEFFHLKKTQRSAVHLFVEEAQLFVPQRCGPDEARMLGAFENIIRLGRNYGIGATLVSQRPQSVNKEVLSQVECLCVLQVNGSHERKALEDWVQEAGADRKLVGELPGLSRGQGFVWSPSWLRVFEKVKFSEKKTFDASATPEVGRQTRTALLSSVDVEALKSDLQEVIAQASKDDPKVLKKRIAELERKQSIAQTDADSRVVDSLKKRVVELESYSGSLAKLVDEYKRRFVALQKCVSPMREMIAYIENKPEDVTLPAITRPLQLSTLSKPITKMPVKKISNPATGLSGPEQRIVNAIAWFESIGINEPEQPAVAFMAGYTYGGGAFNNPRGHLSVIGMVEYKPGNRIALTDVGRARAEFPDGAATNEELHEKVIGCLPGPEQRLLKPLLESYPNAMSNQDLAAASGYTAGAGAFNNPRGRLKTLGLIEYPQAGMVRARELLFPN